jgi:hypothetical protein
MATFAPIPKASEKDCDCGESGIFPQCAQGVAEVLPELAHDGLLQKLNWAGLPPPLRQVGGAFQAL